MASLGNNYGSSSHIRDLQIKYKMACIIDDKENMECIMNAINKSKYNVSAISVICVKKRKNYTPPCNDVVCILEKKCDSYTSCKAKFKGENNGN